MKQENTLMNILGARMSKSGERVNITLVSGEGANTQYRNVSLALENKSKTKVKVENIKGNDYAIVYIPMLKPRANEDVVEDEAYEIPDEVVTKPQGKPFKKVQKASAVYTDDLPF